MLQVQIVVSVKYGQQTLIQQMGKETSHLQGADEMKIIYRKIIKN